MKTFLILLCLILLSSCNPKYYVFLKNDTDKILYFDIDFEEEQNKALNPDSLVLIGGGLWNQKNREILAFGPPTLLLILEKDTVLLEGNRYKQIIDSLWIKSKGAGVYLEVTESWFEEQKTLMR